MSEEKMVCHCVQYTHGDNEQFLYYAIQSEMRIFLHSTRFQVGWKLISCFDLYLFHVREKDARNLLYSTSLTSSGSFFIDLCFKSVSSIFLFYISKTYHLI